ncbi:hypothetical protein BSKO_01681 [Bryopsis sp. KO-2023]|nr:hypothetical protein BSKO_01681 [Bryopsis sp. KO-2023]
MNIIGGVLRLGRGRGDHPNESGRDSSQERPSEVEGGSEGTKPSNRAPNAKELGLRREYHVPHSKSQRRLGYYLEDKCFRKWRIATLEGEVVSESQQTKHYFQRWKLHACTSLVAWMCADQSHARVLQQLEKTCFKEWRTLVQFRCYITNILSEEQQILRKCFREWSGGKCDGSFDLDTDFVEAQQSAEGTQEVGDLAALQDSQDERIIIKRVENIAKRKLVLRVFHRWCENICLEPAWQVQRIRSWRQRKVTRVAFTAWCQIVDRQKLSRETGTELLESVLLKHVFGSWLDAAMVAEGGGTPKDGQTAIAGGLNGASILETRRRENAAMEGWARIMRSKKVLRTAFVLWREEARPQADEVLVKRATSLRWRQCVSTVIKSWNEFAQAKHVQAVLVGRFQARQERLLIRKALQGWCAMKNRMVIAQVAECRADCHFARRFLVKCLRQWHVECLKQQDKCLATRICSNLHTKSSLHRSLNAWKSFTARKHHYRMVTRVIETRRLGKFSHAWLRTTQEAARQRCHLDSAMEHRERYISRAVLSVWNGMVEEKVGVWCGQAESFHTKNLLKRCFLAFREAVSWASAVQHDRRISAMRNSFTKWWEVVSTARMACSAVVQSKCFVCWRVVAKHGDMHLAAKHCRNQLIRMGWTEWFRLYVAPLRMEADRVQRNKLRLKILKAYFIPWHREAYSSYRAQAADLLNLVKENLQHLNLQKPSHIPGPSLQAPERASPAATLGNVQNYPRISMPPDYVQDYGGDAVRQSLYLSQMEPENHPRPS